MVASFDLTRYEPPLDYLLGRIEQLSRLLDHGVDPEFVRDEAAFFLQELAAFCKRRINFAELEARIRESTSIDVGALEEALAVLEMAPRDELLLPYERLANKFVDTRAHFDFLKKKQHTLKFLEVGLRLELLFESVFQDALQSIVDGWDPVSLVQLARKKIELLTEQQQRDLWSRVLSEFRPIDPDEDEAVVADYRLDDNSVLPEGFLESSPPDLLDRLARYHAWLRGRVIRAMIRRGRERWPMPVVGLARILANKRVDIEPSTTEAVVARTVSNIAGWLALRGNWPLSVEQFATLLGLHADSKLLVPRCSGSDRLEPRQFIVRQHHLDRAGLAGNSADETSSFEFDDHLVDSGWRDLEEPLEIGFGRWSTIHQGVRGDERQVLSLFFGESWRWVTGHSNDDSDPGAAALRPSARDPGGAWSRASAAIFTRGGQGGSVGSD